MSACEELQKLFHKTVEDSDFFTYEPYLKKMVLEANAVAQEAGLAAVLEYVSNAPNASRYVCVFAIYVDLLLLKTKF